MRSLLCLMIVLTVTLTGCSSGKNAQTDSIKKTEDSIKQSASSQAPLVSIPRTTPSPSGKPKTYVMASPSKPATKPEAARAVKGIYANSRMLNGSKYKQMLRLLKETDLNAVVIDVKDDTGHKPDEDFLRSKVQELKKEGIYTIARVVVFKDPYAALSKNEWDMKSKRGGTWRDQKGVAWVDPFNKQVWEYNIDSAKHAKAMGFDEIQFDYVRFPDNARKVDAQVRYTDAGGASKSDTIREFLRTAKAALGTIPVSADVFGLTTSTKSGDDMGIGQQWEDIASIVSTISPMIYPSHYGKGEYGIGHPNLTPYSVVFEALKDAKKKNSNLQDAGKSAAAIRPWLQDFTATWMKPHLSYTNVEVQEQIKAAKEQGIDQFLLWNPSGVYSYR